MLQVAGFRASNGDGLANSPRAMSKIVPPMSNVKTKDLKSRGKTKISFFHHAS